MSDKKEIVRKHFAQKHGEKPVRYESFEPPKWVLDAMEEYAVEHLSRIEDILPETFYEANTLEFRLEKMVHQWRKGTKAANLLPELKQKLERYRNFARVWNSQEEMLRFGETVDDVFTLIKEVENE